MAADNLSTQQSGLDVVSENSPELGEAPQQAASLLSLPAALKQGRQGHRKMPLVRSSLPNMPLRDIVTPQRPLPASLAHVPAKVQKHDHVRPPQLPKSGYQRSSSHSGGHHSPATTDNAGGRYKIEFPSGPGSQASVNEGFRTVAVVVVVAVAAVVRVISGP